MLRSQPTTMNNRNPKKLKSSQRQKLSARRIIIAGISFAAIAIGAMIYFQLNESEPTKAENGTFLTHENLPVDLNISAVMIQAPDTLQRNGARYKIPKPLSQTPAIPK
ncbi:MAG: hypothetical protein IPL22_04170 [Bacteroidetes bacterium]|nr:hypothetical protein [Bacteroidota bacterium]